MTVLTTDNRRSYAGDGSTTVFAFPVFFLEAADVKVALRVNDVESTPVFNTDYTVSGAGNPSGGSVTFTTAPVSGATVIIFNDPALTQTVDYQDNDEFPAETHERALDKLTLLVQRLSARLARTLQYDETAPTVLTASQVLTRVDDAETARDQAQAAQVAAATSETNAAASASAAATSAALVDGPALRADIDANTAELLLTAKLGTAQTFTATQKANELALTHNTAWNGAASQNLTVNVNGSNFTVANPTTPVSGAYYALTVTYTTSHTLAWGSVFRGVSAITPTATAGTRDHFVFRYDGTHMQCVGFRPVIGEA